MKPKITGTFVVLCVAFGLQLLTPGVAGAITQAKDELFVGRFEWATGSRDAGVVSFVWDGYVKQGLTINSVVIRLRGERVTLVTEEALLSAEQAVRWTASMKKPESGAHELSIEIRGTSGAAFRFTKSMSNTTRSTATIQSS
ncbi:MAG: hypothetical protein IPH48_15285 [bacterium]|nr:hypothetical protein [bacterium]